MGFKKIISLFGVVILSFSTFTSCGASTEKEKDTEYSSESSRQISSESSSQTSDQDSTELFQEIMRKVGEEGRFNSIGGSMLEPVDGAPGKIKLSDTDFLTNTLFIPNEIQENIDEVSTLIDVMNTNNFTGMCCKVKDISTEDFARKLSEGLKTAQFICGRPEKLLIASNEDHVVALFGLTDYIDAYEKAIKENFNDMSVIESMKYE